MPVLTKVLQPDKEWLLPRVPYYDREEYLGFLVQCQATHDTVWSDTLQQYIAGQMGELVSDISASATSVVVRPKPVGALPVTPQWPNDGQGFKIVVADANNVEHINYTASSNPTVGSAPNFDATFTVTRAGGTASFAFQSTANNPKTFVYFEVYDTEYNANRLRDLCVLIDNGRATATQQRRAEILVQKLTSAPVWNESNRDWRRHFDKSNTALYHPATTYWVREALERALRCEGLNVDKSLIRRLLDATARNGAGTNWANYDQESAWGPSPAIQRFLDGGSRTDHLGAAQTHLRRTIKWLKETIFDEDGSYRYSPATHSSGEAVTTIASGKPVRPGQAVIDLTDGSIAPTPGSGNYPNPSTIIIVDGDKTESVTYTGKSGNQLTGVSGVKYRHEPFTSVQVHGVTGDTNNALHWHRIYYDLLVLQGFEYLKEALAADPYFLTTEELATAKFLLAHAIGNWIGSHPYWGDVGYRSFQTVTANPLPMLAVIRTPQLQWDAHMAGICRGYLDRWLDWLKSLDRAVIGPGNTSNTAYAFGVADGFPPIGVEGIATTLGREEDKAHHWGELSMYVGKVIDCEEVWETDALEAPVNVRFDGKQKRVLFVGSKGATCFQLMFRKAPSPLIPPMAGPEPVNFTDRIGRCLTSLKNSMDSVGSNDNVIRAFCVLLKKDNTGGLDHEQWNISRDGLYKGADEFTLFDAEGIVKHSDSFTAYNTTLRKQYAAHATLMTRMIMKEQGSGTDSDFYCDTYWTKYEDFDERGVVMTLQAGQSAYASAAQLRVYSPLYTDVEVRRKRPGTDANWVTVAIPNNGNTSDSVTVNKAAGYYAIRYPQPSANYVSGFVMVQTRGANPNQAWFLRNNNSGAFNSETPLTRTAIIFPSVSGGALADGDELAFLYLPFDGSEEDADRCFVFASKWETNKNNPWYGIWWTNGRRIRGASDQNVIRSNWLSWTSRLDTNFVEVLGVTARQVRAIPSANGNLTMAYTGLKPGQAARLTVVDHATGALLTGIESYADESGAISLTFPVAAAGDYRISVSTAPFFN